MFAIIGIVVVFGVLGAILAGGESTSLSNSSSSGSRSRSSTRVGLEALEGVRCMPLCMPEVMEAMACGLEVPDMVRCVLWVP